MKIMPRLVTLFKSKAHDTMNYLEDPGSIARQMVRELALQIAQTEEMMADVLGEEKTIAKKHERAIQEMNVWKLEAEKAVKAERDDLARKALEKAYKSEQLSLVYATSLDVLSPKIAEMREKIDDLKKMKERHDQESLIIDVRVKAANLSAKTSKILGNIGITPLNFDSLNEKIDKLESKAEALKELSNQDDSTVFQRDMAQMKVSHAIEESLSKMKSQLKEDCVYVH